MENIKAAAIKCGERWPLIVTSHDHDSCMGIVEGKGIRGTGTKGFMTNENRFVLRDEAGEIAFKAGQLNKKEGRNHLQSFHLKLEG